VPRSRVPPPEVKIAEPFNWGRLYAAATLAGAGVGVLLVLGLLPAIPPQVTTWIRGVDDNVLAVLVPVIGGALIGLALTAVAHIGVAWQLCRRGKPRVD
jgi:hypothetical protein